MAGAGRPARSLPRTGSGARALISLWLDELGLPCVGRVTTMVKGEPLRRQGDAHIFSLVSQALG
jgi:hypothetical protein